MGSLKDSEDNFGSGLGELLSFTRPFYGVGEGLGDDVGLLLFEFPSYEL